MRWLNADDYDFDEDFSNFLWSELRETFITEHNFRKTY